MRARKERNIYSARFLSASVVRVRLRVDFFGVLFVFITWSNVYAARGAECTNARHPVLS